ncbi:MULTISPECIES: tol-pal system YbgF family protein [unclassified Paenibacillus]|uniref:tol-pal system YbgF family protein n=1 Tax=unclassified Paenibacillus TaxID=185978 RepID=UPI003628E617
MTNKKNRKKPKLALGLCIWTVAAAVSVISLTDAGQPAASIYAMENSEASNLSQQLARSVNEAKQAFESNHSIPPDLLEQLAEGKEQLIPIALKQLSLEPMGAEADRSKEHTDLSSDWRFWAEASLPWKDTRLLNALLDWTRDYPVDMYESELYVRFVAEALQDGQKDRLLQQLDSADRRGTQVLLSILQYKGWLDESQYDSWLATYKGKPQYDGIIDYLIYSRSTNYLKRIYDRNELSPAQMQSVISALVSIRNYDEETSKWLKQLAAATKNVSIEQMIDQELVLHQGDRAAAERLYQSGTSGGFMLPLNGRVEKVLADLYPDGELAAGIRLYEKIRGKPYFYGLDDQWYSPEGNDYAQPVQAAAQWQGFLQQYPKHPAADDAAYRLARCYQLAGDGENALYWLNEAVHLGDRDLTYDARGMLIFVLDVEMTSDALAAVDSKRLPSWMKPWIDYSQAVEYIRARKYREAASALHALIDTYGGKDIFAEAYAVNRADKAEVIYPEDRYPFWERINAQLQLTERAAKLVEEAEQAAGAEKADRQYALAAMIYREPLMYYNHLWRETRQSFFWFGHIKEMDYYEPLDRYIGRFNHLIQAIDQFKAIDIQEAGEQTAAKSLYSTALSYSKLTYYGEEASYYLTISQLNEKAAAYAKQLVESFPESELADDALLLLYAHTQDKQWLEQVEVRYPDGDQVKKARELLEQLAAKESKRAASLYGPYEPISTVYYERLQRGDSRLSSSVSQWIEEHRGTSYHGTLADGDWVYVLLSVDEGKSIDYINIGSKKLQMQVTWQERTADAVSDKQDMLLARVKKKFVLDGDWAWKLYSP